MFGHERQKLLKERTSRTSLIPVKNDPIWSNSRSYYHLSKCLSSFFTLNPFSWRSMFGHDRQKLLKERTSGTSLIPVKNDPIWSNSRSVGSSNHLSNCLSSFFTLNPFSWRSMFGHERQKLLKERTSRTSLIPVKNDPIWSNSRSVGSSMNDVQSMAFSGWKM